MNRRDCILAGQNALFRGMDFSTVEYMLEHCSVRMLSMNEPLLSPDTPNQHLYLILDGELGVHLIGQQAMQHTTLVAGDCAGDISIVDGKLPSALVIASRPSRVLVVPHDTVWSLVHHSHEVARNLLEIIAGRMRNDNHAIITSQTKRMHFEHQASVDALTGIHNRRWMCEAFPRTLLRCARSGQFASIMLVDIDFFKQVNDNHGHLVGDVALSTVAECLSRNLRSFDLLVRYGGEEFAILLPGTAEREAATLAERLRAAVAAARIQTDEFELQVTISIGIASTCAESTLETLLGEADRALYRAKNLGRNRVELAGQAGVINA